MRNQPESAQTLKGAKDVGTLAPLDRIRLRAQLGMADDVTASNIRRATALMIHRIADYYTVIQYTGPSYVYGRVDSDYPSALKAIASHNYMDDSWSYREMTPAHPTCSNESLFTEAGWMCIDTACRLAAWEMSEEVPEARPILDQARYAVKSLCEAREVSEMNWQTSRRRLGTPGIQKIIKRIIAKLRFVRIGKGAVRPVVIPQGSISMVNSYRNVTDWSAEDQQVALVG